MKVWIKAGVIIFYVLIYSFLRKEHVIHMETDMHVSELPIFWKGKNIFHGK